MAVCLALWCRAYRLSMDVIFLKALNFHFGPGVLQWASPLSIYPLPACSNKCIRNNKCAELAKWSMPDKKPARMCQYASLATAGFPSPSTVCRHGHCKLMAFKVVKQQEMQFAGRSSFVGHQQLIGSTKETRAEFYEFPRWNKKFCTK